MLVITESEINEMKKRLLSIRRICIVCQKRIIKYMKIS